MIRTERWKLIHYPKIGRFQLFDLGNDPLELQKSSNGRNSRRSPPTCGHGSKRARKSAGDPLLNP